jgi:hypothetical protein
MIVCRKKDRRHNNMKKAKINNMTKYIILLVLFAGILLVIPSLVRTFNNNPYIINSEAYHNIRIYNQDGNTNYDSLQGHDIEMNILDMIRLGDTGKYILFRIVPMILGLLTVVFTYLVLKKHNATEKVILAILALMIVSPIFLYIFTDYKTYSFIIFLNVLGLYFLSDHKAMFSGITLGIIPFIDIYAGILTLLLLMVYIFASSRNHASSRITSIVILTAIILSIIINIYYGYDIWHLLHFESQNIITDIGADIGLSFSVFIIAIIGLILLWENGWRNLITYILMILFVILSFFNTTTRIYMNFILIIYAGFAFVYLNRRKWSITIIKKTTILLIICSIFFSTLVYNTRIIRSEPSPEYIDALKFVSNQSLPSETIVDYPGYGYMTEYYTGRRVFVDDDTKYYDSERVAALDTLATSRNLDRTESIMKKYDLKYIIVSQEFNTYLKDKEGLLFLMDTSQKFKSIYKNDAVEVWMYIG